MSFDHDAFLDDENLSSDATFNGSEIRVCLSLDPEELALGGDMSPQAIAGRAGCKTTDVSGAKRGDILIVNEVSYRVLKVHTDETGWTTLFLGKSYA
jgi:hypothetical protein